MTGLQHAQRKLAQSVLEAVKEFESVTPHSVIGFDIPLLKAEQEATERAVVVKSKDELDRLRTGQPDDDE